jgi:hypothetical protein
LYTASVHQKQPPPRTMVCRSLMSDLLMQPL